MMSEASPRAAAAIDSPSALMIFARFSRSASACRAIARFMVSGSWMSLSSTRVTWTPQSTVVTSRIVPDVDVDLVRLGERLVQGVLPDDLAQRGLGDLIDGGVDVLDRDDGLDRVDDPEVRHRRDVHADVVAGDDALRLDGHRDDPQRDPVHDVDERDDHAQARCPYSEHPAESEQHTLLVLLHHLDRHRQQQEGDDRPR